MAIKNFSMTPPAAGEPIDLTFMTTLAEYIKAINEQMVASKMAISSIDTGGIRKTLETEDVSIWTGYVTLPKILKSAAPKSYTWTVNYSAQVAFQSRPIVYATPYITTDTVSHSCWVTKADQGSASGMFRFNEKTTRDHTPSILILAIGTGVVK